MTIKSSNRGNHYANTSANTSLRKQDSLDKSWVLGTSVNPQNNSTMFDDSLNGVRYTSNGTASTESQVFSDQQVPVSLFQRQPTFVHSSNGDEIKNIKITT